MGQAEPTARDCFPHFFALERMANSKRDDEQRQEAKSDRAFERWVSRQLHKIYDEVLNEDVPPELLAVVERACETPTREGDGKADDKLAHPAGGAAERKGSSVAANDTARGRPSSSVGKRRR